MFQYVRIRHQYGEDVASRGAGLASNSGCGSLKIIASDVRMYVYLYIYIYIYIYGFVRESFVRYVALKRRCRDEV